MRVGVWKILSARKLNLTHVEWKSSPERSWRWSNCYSSRTDSSQPLCCSTALCSSLDTWCKILPSILYFVAPHLFLGSWRIWHLHFSQPRSIQLLKFGASFCRLLQQLFTPMHITGDCTEVHFHEAYNEVHGIQINHHHHHHHYHIPERKSSFFFLLQSTNAFAKVRF